MNTTNTNEDANDPAPPTTASSAAARGRSPAQIFEELQSTLEELRVADEEMRVQNEELAAAREVIEAERARYADLFAFAPDAYFVTTTAGVIREANQAAAQMLRLAPGLLPGKPFVTFVTPDARPDFRARLLQLPQTGRIADWGVLLTPRHGPPFPAALTVAVVRDARSGHAAGLRWLARDIGERVRTEQARQELLRRLVSAQESERRHIARELHDEMGQHLTALLLGLRSLRDVLPAGAPAAAQERRRHLQTIADQMGREVHHLALELRPTALDDLGLCIALQGYVEAWEQRTGIPTDFHVGGFGTARVPAHLETTIYRTVQEALTNVARHAHATRVSVILERCDSHVLAIMEDNGTGFDAEAAMRAQGRGTGRLGLLGMHERVALAGGTVTIESSPSSGATVFLRLPVPGSAGGKPAGGDGTTRV